MKRTLTFLAMALMLPGVGCKPKASTKEISTLQRREAESLVSEAKFALSVRDVARAEASLAKATAIVPDVGDYWLELGRCRVKLGNRGGAKDAYKSALDVYRTDATREAAVRVPAILRQIYVLALLGRADEARTLLAKSRKDLPDSADLRAFEEGKQLDQMLASPVFKEVAL